MAGWFFTPVNFVKFGQCFWAGETAGLFRFAVSRQYLIGVFFLERFYAFKNAVSKIPFTGQSSKVFVRRRIQSFFAQSHLERENIFWRIGAFFQMIVP